MRSAWRRIAAAISSTPQRDGAPGPRAGAAFKPAASIAARSDPNRAATTLALGQRPGSERYRADPPWPRGRVRGRPVGQAGWRARQLDPVADRLEHPLLGPDPPFLARTAPAPLRRALAPAATACRPPAAATLSSVASSPLTLALAGRVGAIDVDRRDGQAELCRNLASRVPPLLQPLDLPHPLSSRTPPARLWIATLNADRRRRPAEKRREVDRVMSLATFAQHAVTSLANRFGARRVLGMELVSSQNPRIGASIRADFGLWNRRNPAWQAGSAGRALESHPGGRPFESGWPAPSRGPCAAPTPRRHARAHGR